MATALAFALRNWKLLLGGLVLAVLGIMLLSARAESRHFRKLYDADHASLQLEIAKHGITRSSLNTCLASIDTQNAAVTALKTEADKRQAAGQRAVEEAQRATVGAEARARGLEASAAKVGRDSERPICKPSDAFWKARDGL